MTWLAPGPFLDQKSALFAEDLLAQDEAADQFVGGTIYQAFLSATNYHRWHSPVAGTIVRGRRPGGHLLLGG